MSLLSSAIYRGCLRSGSGITSRARKAHRSSSLRASPLLSLPRPGYYQPRRLQRDLRIWTALEKYLKKPKDWQPKAGSPMQKCCSRALGEGQRARHRSSIRPFPEATWALFPSPGHVGRDLGAPNHRG